MTFLELCKRVHLLLRIGEGTPGTEPSTVVGQTKVLFEIVEWVKAAHDDICKLRSAWKFLQGRATLALPEGGRILTPSAIELQVADFDKLMPLVRNDYAYILIAPSDEDSPAEAEVIYVPAQQFYGRYDMTPISTGMPRYFTLRDDGALEFDTLADRDYDVRVHYRKDITTLAEDDDEPMFDSRYHMAIVEWAIVHYYCAGRDGVRETLIKHDTILRREMNKLFNEQLPDFTAY